VHLLRYVVKCKVTDLSFNTQRKFFEVSSICMDTFSDQRTCNLTKRCSVVDASYSASSSLE
jgi:hypothetical protein